MSEDFWIGMLCGMVYWSVTQWFVRRRNRKVREEILGRDDG